jgi:hypothetical protein
MPSRRRIDGSQPRYLLIKVLLLFAARTALGALRLELRFPFPAGDGCVGVDA